MHVASGGAVHNEAKRPAHLECRHANAATHTRIERLRRDLRAAKHHKSVDCFKRNPLTAFGRGHEQGAAAMLDAGSVISHVDGVQVAHWNTTFSM